MMEFISKLQIIILILSVIDLTATYAYINTFHDKFPQLDAIKLEANPILRMAMKEFGISKGMILGGIIVFAIVFLIIFSMSLNWLWYLCGVLSMMIVYHFLNFSQIVAMKGVG